MRAVTSERLMTYFSLVSQALAKFQTSHEQSTRSGIEQEESMLSESHARETSLNSQILELEMDARSVRCPPGQTPAKSVP